MLWNPDERVSQWITINPPRVRNQLQRARVPDPQQLDRGDREYEKDDEEG